MSNLSGKVAVVTGAAQGLGYAIVRALAQEKMRLVLMDVKRDQLESVAAQLRTLGAECLSIAVDLADAGATGQAIEQALSAFGAPHILIHNAALLKERSMLEIDLQNWQRETNIILQAAFILSKAVWKPMIDAGGGAIVYLSSGSGVKGFVKEVAYCPAKHGQEGLMKVLAMEGEPFGITVNTITPGAPINTPMSAENYNEELKQKWVDPALLAPAFVYLAQQAGNPELTGQRLNAWEVAQAQG
jgi:NAD(P)-dependent dehydrogenase (short-subunit alcohol dehydrogenase family)